MSRLMLITLSFLFSHISNFGDTHAKQLCRPKQRDVLLEFKDEFETPNSHDSCFVNNLNRHPRMKSWMYNKDCCDWDGIKCDLKSGEVIELDLSFSCLHGHTSLFKLKNLPSLNSLSLSHNNLSGEVLFSIGNLSHLTFLDLSNNLFSGGIPLSIGNLSHLASLDLSDNYFSGEISSLTENLPHLTTLGLSNNHFGGKIPFSVGNLSLLTILGLSNNNFDGEIPSSFASLNRLNTLMFRDNNLSGKFPTALLNLTKLSILGISYNHFTGTLPANINSLSNLLYFDASVNSFSGTLPAAFFAISSLRYLDMSNNQLNGTLEFGNVSSSSNNLVSLFLGNNNFRGPIPVSISKLANLVILNISNYNVQGGPVDFSIFSPIKGLTQLYISHLNTTTTIDLNAVLSLHLKSISILDLSGNHVSTTNKSSVANQPLQRLSSLSLSDCGITEFPDILTRLENRMTELHIPNNKIKGQVPGWLWTLIRYVNLSNNTFNGFETPTTKSPSSVTYLFASDNNFTGEIPSFICTLDSLDTLDLSNNNFNGPIPRCIGNLKSNLSRLILRQNRLSGSLPENIYGNLISLDVGNNQLVGKLPRSLIHSSTLEVLNVESNMINDSFPFWLTSLQNLQILVLRSNAFHGSIQQQTRFAKLRIMDISRNNFSGTLPSVFFSSWTAMSTLDEEQDEEMYMGSGYYHDSMVLMNKGVAMELVRILKIYTAVDFSGNKLEGEIPNSIGLLKELRVLNLSSNAFSRRIPPSLGDLKALESLDVSRNKLSGGIPQELGSLSYLSHMNFSHNHLAGLVPGGTQFRTQGCSSFDDNDGLFGPALDEVCRRTNPERDETPLEPEREGEHEEEVLSWVAAGVGFVPGIIFGFTIGCMLISYRPEWFVNIFGPSRRRRASTTAR
ncbi:receptor-like protein 35 [Raphanus sativus]|uniref:Receptor-like protein 35 n=1 Tax=Raphanus sativus TaxID=3726 RepID=A0A9W3BT63_RAPSA|nr:receptor-like protein 35 [Raphanus sativus]